MRHGEHELMEKLLEVMEQVVNLLKRIEAGLYKNQSTTAQLGADQMATTATLTFVDASGNPAAPPTGDGSGIDVTFASDNANVTVGPASANGDTATATITGTEAFNLSATVANTSGAALLDDDGTTAFVQPSPIAVAASTPPAPQAVTATLSAE